MPAVVTAAQESIAKEVAAIRTLAETAGKYPYYRFNYSWTRTVQDAVSPSSTPTRHDILRCSNDSASPSSSAATLAGSARTKEGSYSRSRKLGK